MTDACPQKKRKIVDLSEGVVEKAIACLIELGDGSQLYCTPGNDVGVAKAGEYTNTSPARRTWTFDPSSGIISFANGCQLCKTPADRAGVLPAEEGTQEASRTWKIDRQSGIVSLADGKQLYKRPDGHGALDFAGSGSNTEEARRAWKIREVQAPITCLIELADGSQLHRTADNWANVFPASSGKNTSLDKCLWTFEPDSGIISLVVDGTYQLFNTPWDLAAVFPAGQGTNIEEARRAWKIDRKTGIISLADGKQLHKQLDLACASLSHADIGTNTEDSRRVWKIRECSTADCAEALTAKKVSINVKSLSGSTVAQVEMYEEETIEQLKMKLEQDLNLLVAEQKLLLDTAIDLSDPNKKIGEFLSGREQADVLMVKLYAEKVYFLGLAWGWKPCGISASGVQEGGQLYNAHHEDLFKKIPKGGDNFAFQRVGSPGLYMVADEHRNLVLGKPDEQREVFRQAASWNGDSAKSSFESKRFPGCWIAHRNGKMHVRTNDGGHFYGDASWQLVE